MSISSRAQKLAVRLAELEKTFVGMPQHAKRECQGNDTPYEQALCEAKQFDKFNEHFVIKLWGEINRTLCVNRDQEDRTCHDTLCDEIQRLSERVEQSRIDALGRMIRFSEDRPKHHEILSCDLVAAGGLPADQTVSAISA